MGGGGSMASGEEARGWGARGGNSSIRSGSWERRRGDRSTRPLLGDNVPAVSALAALCPTDFLPDGKRGRFQAESLGRTRQPRRLLRLSSAAQRPHLPFLASPPLIPQGTRGHHPASSLLLLTFLLFPASLTPRQPIKSQAYFVLYIFMASSKSRQDSCLQNFSNRSLPRPQFRMHPLPTPPPHPQDHRRGLSLASRRPRPPRPPRPLVPWKASQTWIRLWLLLISSQGMSPESH